jgi:xanthine dehydrogenase YagR molybdenum-binding subunit
MSTASVGKPLDRVDGRQKVTGKAAYSAEIRVANVAYAVIVTSTVANGKVGNIEARAAERSPGVLTVMTHKNAPKLPGGGGIGKSGGRVLQLLQDDRVLYDGQPIAVVVADTFEHATRAASLLDVHYDAGTAHVALRVDDPSAFPPPTSPPRAPPDSSRGDIDGAFRSAEVKLEQTYTTQHQTHNPMEPHATIAVWQGPDKLTLYDATQGIFNVQRRAAEVFGIPRENVRVISHFLGGGFGCKGSPWSHVILAAMAAKVAGRPVKLVLTRQQMFAFVGYRPPTIQRVSLAAAKNGKLMGIRHEVVASTSTFDEFIEPSAYVTRMLYSCPAVKTSHKLVRLDVATPTFTRAPGEASGSFAIESAMDELSYQLRIDPLELRLINYADRDEEEGKPFSSKSLKDCYRRAAERFGWSRRKPEPRSMKDGHQLVGLGMATATYPARVSPASALARIKADGTALVLSGSQDIGTGTYTIMTQIAADALTLPFEKVRFDLGDTSFPEAPLSAGSRTAASVGPAVHQACLEAQRKLKQLAIADNKSPLHGLDPEKLDAEAGVFYAKGNRAQADAFIEILRRRGLDEIEGRAEVKEKDERKKYSTHSFGAQFAEVRVDEDLGEIRVARWVGAFAGGKILNAKTARSQLLGAVVWGIGFALLEDTARDARSGRIVTKDLADYHVPVNADVPPIDIIMVDETDPFVNDVGVKGLGELGIVGAAAAIANAVYHATGKRVRDLPITLDKLIVG